jgi:hypothetical protein
MYEPQHLQPYTRPKYYFGATWEGWYPVYSVHRDSGCLNRSNFRVIERELLALPERWIEEDGEELRTVQVTRASHFAVGWVDTIYIHATDEEAVEAADRMIGRIADYPPLDEEDWSDLEYETAAACWERFSLRDRVEACTRFKVSIFAARRSELPSDDSGELVSYLAK